MRGCQTQPGEGRSRDSLEASWYGGMGGGGRIEKWWPGVIYRSHFACLLIHLCILLLFLLFLLAGRRGGALYLRKGLLWQPRVVVCNLLFFCSFVFKCQSRTQVKRRLGCFKIYEYYLNLFLFMFVCHYLITNSSERLMPACLLAWPSRGSVGVENRFILV